MAYNDMQAGQAVTTHHVVYMDGLLIRPAIANAPATMPALGIVEATMQSGGRGDVLIRGLLSNGALSGFLASGQPVYVSPLSAGLVTASSPTASGTVVQRLGMARTNTSLELNVEDNFIIVSA